MDLESQINQKGYKLFELLSVKDFVKPKDADAKLQHAIDNDIFILDESKVITPLIFTRPDILDNSTSIGSVIDGKEIEIDSNNYHKLNELIEEFLSIEYFEIYADYKFLEGSIFKWIIDLYKKKKCDLELYNYVSNQLESNLEENTFYFRVIALEIEDEFTVGNCKFLYLENDFFESRFDVLLKAEKLKSDEKDSFMKLHKDFFKKTMISTRVKGVDSKSESLAKREVELSVNALKCLLLNESFKPNSELFNVDFNYKSSGSVKFISAQNELEHFKFWTQGKSSVAPIYISKKEFIDIQARGLLLLHNFLINKTHTDFYYELENSIVSFGEMNSAMNIYERIVKLISFFEALTIPRNSNRAKGQSNLKKVIEKLDIPNLSSNPEIPNKSQYIIYVNKIYMTRDKYIHNRTELPIDANQLFAVVLLGMLFLMYCVQISKDVKTLDDLHKHFDFI